MSEIIIGLIDYNTPLVSSVAIQQLVDSFPGVAVVVVKNGTSVGPLPGAARIIEPGENTGFAGGCNLLIADARARNAEALWILNNDCIASPDALDEYLRLSQTTDADLLTSVALLGATEAIWYGGGTHDSTRIRQTHQHYGEIYSPSHFPDHFSTTWASGANMFVPRRTLERVAPFDEQLFLYLEELDWQLRNHLQVVCSGRALVRHFAGSTTRNLSSDLEFFFVARNRVILHRKRPRGPSLLFWTSWISDHLLKPLMRRQVVRARLALKAARAARISGPKALDVVVDGRRSHS